MKNQTLFSSKDKSKKLKCHLLQFLFGALRVKTFLLSGPNTKRRDFIVCHLKKKIQITIFNGLVSFFQLWL